jgi:hypothetical protein
MRFGTVQASTGDSGILKPSVPEFTVKYVDYSYDVPPTYGIDSYTGENVITEAGYHVSNRTIEFTIKNHPFTSYKDASGNYTGLFYNVRFKGHYVADEWSYHPYDADNGYRTGSYSDTYNASQSDYTVILVRLDVEAVGRMRLMGIPAGGQVDFQMQALIGHLDKIYTGSSGFSWVGGDSDHYFVFTGETSDWSNTQTVIIGESQTPTPSPTTTPTPTPPPAPTPIPVPGQSYFFVESNSTVSALFFNSTSSELSFTVSGPSETAGYVKVTIAKSLVSSVQNVKVYFDGSQLNVAITEDADSWLLSFTYTHSTHHVRISLAANAAPTTFLGIDNWIWAGVVIIIVVVGVGLLLYLKKRKH